MLIMHFIALGLCGVDCVWLR